MAWKSRTPTLHFIFRMLHIRIRVPSFLRFIHFGFGGFRFHILWQGPQCPSAEQEIDLFQGLLLGLLEKEKHRRDRDTDI